MIKCCLPSRAGSAAVARSFQVTWHQNFANWFVVTRHHRRLAPLTCVRNHNTQHTYTTHNTPHYILHTTHHTQHTQPTQHTTHNAQPRTTTHNNTQQHTTTQHATHITQHTIHTIHTTNTQYTQYTHKHTTQHATHITHNTQRTQRTTPTQWLFWHVVNYAVLGTDSQAIRGLYASVQFSDKVVFLPGVGQRLALLVQTVQMPVEFPQVQYSDKDVLMPVFVPVYSSLLVSTVDTSFAENFIFYVNWWITDPEVDSRRSLLAGFAYAPRAVLRLVLFRP